MWLNSQFPADLVTFIKEILTEKPHLLCSVGRLDLTWSLCRITTLHEKCPYLEFFWSVFSRIWTEYREIQSTSQLLVQMWENTDQKNSEYGHFLHNAKYIFSGQVLYQYQQIAFVL